MNRREFLTATCLVLTSGKILKDVCENEYEKYLINKIYSLPEYTILAKHKFTLEEDRIKENQGYGIIINQQYYTFAHIFEKEEMIKTPFGYIKIPLDVKEEEHTIYGKKLEKVVCDYEKDIAIFNLSSDLNLPNFPAEPSDELFLGDEVYIVGNPSLEGPNIRKANISRVNALGVNGEKNAGYFGVDKIIIPGDSGTPVVSKDFKLLGLSSFVKWDLGYIKKIGEFNK